MQYRYYDGDMERWDEKGINMSVDELKKRFGTRDLGVTPGRPGAELSDEIPQVDVEIDIDRAYQPCEPQFDINDQELAQQQYEEFLRAGRREDSESH